MGIFHKKRKVSFYVSGAVRQFSLWFANASIGGGTLLRGYEDDFYELFREENSWVEQAFAIFVNNLEVDELGVVLNYEHSEMRAAQFVRSCLDREYTIEPPLEQWETALYPVSTDAYNK